MKKNKRIRQKWKITIYGMDSSLLEIVERIALENQRQSFSDNYKAMEQFIKSPKMQHLSVVHDLDNDCMIIMNSTKLVCSVGINSYSPLILQNGY